ncbi:MAG: arsenate reductase family protein [Eubacteriales bacterium]|nr:arsenate reductase family protein [Eubacteriales bacterium]MDD3199352.1 arsenate reductase family protein [Eubacteriales bacterium]MDD4122026.1 arsenate reductase family protein [Eubacteriales bacterium]MDD4629229.1 arsenate reductase family protein [Eubacteriales bacterium]
MVFICYSRCTTCKKARVWLDENKIQYEFREIKSDNPNVEELRYWHAKSGLPLKRFFNTSGNIYKELDLKNRLIGMSEEEQLKLLASDGMLVKRPILIGDDLILVGFKEEEWERALR